MLSIKFSPWMFYFKPTQERVEHKTCRIYANSKIICFREFKHTVKEDCCCSKEVGRIWSLLKRQEACIKKFKNNIEGAYYLQ
jgi:hypothetical protein